MKSHRWLNLGLLGTGLTTAASGFLVQSTYHGHHGVSARASRLLWGLGYPAWALIHQICSALMLVVVVWHLWLNRKPLFMLLTRASQWRKQAPFFFALFGFSVVTAVVAWMAGKLFGDASLEHVLVEIHDKLTIPMSILLVTHTWQRRARLLR